MYLFYEEITIDAAIYWFVFKGKNIQCIKNEIKMQKNKIKQFSPYKEKNNGPDMWTQVDKRLK